MTDSPRDYAQEAAAGAMRGVAESAQEPTLDHQAVNLQAAQVVATLSVGAAILDLADAIRQHGRLI